MRELLRACHLSYIIPLLMNFGRELRKPPSSLHQPNDSGNKLHSAALTGIARAGARHGSGANTAPTDENTARLSFSGYLYAPGDIGTTGRRDPQNTGLVVLHDTTAPDNYHPVPSALVFSEIDPDNISYTDSNGMFKYNFDTFSLKWGARGNGDGQFDRPWDVATDSSGNVYVVDTYNYRVQKFDSQGNFLAKWGTLGYGDGQFGLPIGAALDSSDNLYITDANGCTIQIFDSNGGFIRKWGSQGSGDGQFNQPRGIAVDLDGNIYVADTFNHRVQKFVKAP